MYWSTLSESSKSGTGETVCMVGRKPKRSVRLNKEGEGWESPNKSNGMNSKVPRVDEHCWALKWIAFKRKSISPPLNHHWFSIIKYTYIRAFGRYIMSVIRLLDITWGRRIPLQTAFVDIILAISLLSGPSLGYFPERVGFKLRIPSKKSAKGMPEFISFLIYLYNSIDANCKIAILPGFTDVTGIVVPVFPLKVKSSS